MNFWKRKLAVFFSVVIALAGSFFWIALPQIAHAAPASTAVTSGGSDVTGTVYTLASETPTANNLNLLTFAIRNATSVNPSILSVTGNSLTWVKVNSVNYDDTSSSRRTLEVWRAMGASPTTGAITVTTNEVESATTWSLVQYSGVNQTGTNGSGAVPQSATAFNDTGTGTSISATLAAFSDSNSATFGGFGGGDAGAPLVWTVGSGYTLIASSAPASNAINVMTEGEGSNNTTVNASMSSTIEIGVVALEIAPPPTIPTNYKLTLQNSKTTVQQAKLTVGPQRVWAISSIDVMKSSKDVICGQPATSTVDTYLDLIKAAGANFVSVSGYFDDPVCASDIPLLNKWNTEARARGLHVWWRMKDLEWEGDYSTTKATSTISGGVHQTRMDSWITANSNLLQSGDVMTPFAEVQNGGINGVNSCTTNSQNVCQFATPAEFNTFIRVVQADAEARVPVGVQVGYWGFDGFIAAGLCNVGHSGTTYLEAATITAMHNIVAIDHYPENCPSTFTTDLPIIHTALPGSSIVIGETGSITATGDDSQVQFFRTEMPPLLADPLVVGFNYWNLGPAGQEQLYNGTNTRPGYFELQRWLETVKH